MNFNFYIFGNPSGLGDGGSRYVQYPNDYTREFLQPLCEDIEGERAMIYRKGELMHYAYVKEFGEGCYIGCCVILNDAMIKYSKAFFRFLGNFIDKEILDKGKFVMYGYYGGIAFKVEDFSEEEDSYIDIKSLINKALESNKYGINKLTTNFSGENCTEYVSFSEANNLINELAEKYNKVILQYNCEVAEDVCNKLDSGLSEVASRTPESKDPENEVSKLRILYLFSGVLVVLVCAMGLWLLSMYKKNERTEYALKGSMELYDEKQINDSIQKAAIDSLNKENRRIVSERDALSRAIPFVITSCSYSSGNEILTCRYFSSMPECTKYFTIKVVRDDCEYYSYYQSKSFYQMIHKGSGSFTVDLPLSTDCGSGNVIELWYEGRIVAGVKDY